MERKEIEVYKNYKGCWMISSHKRDHGGYARFERNNKRWMIHRWIYNKYKGTIPDNLCVCHICDQPGCINPDHLFLGTHKDNMKDKINKNRSNHANGERINSSKLNVKNVKEIRVSTDSIKDISYKYGITTVHVRDIKRRLYWAHLI